MAPGQASSRVKVIGSSGVEFRARITVALRSICRSCSGRDLAGSMLISTVPQPACDTYMTQRTLDVCDGIMCPFFDQTRCELRLTRKENAGGFRTHFWTSR